MAASGEDCLGILLATGVVNVTYFHNSKAVIVKIKKTTFKYLSQGCCSDNDASAHDNSSKVHFDTF